MCSLQGFPYGDFSLCGVPPKKKFAHLTPLEKSPIKFLLTLHQRLIPPIE